MLLQAKAACDKNNEDMNVASDDDYMGIQKKIQRVGEAACFIFEKFILNADPSV